MRVSVVDPSAFTPPYDHALCIALARAGAAVELVTSRFAYGEAPAADGYRRRELFYRHARGTPASRVRRVCKLAEHVPDMLRYGRVARAADVVHFQWLDVQWLDRHLLPDRPVLLTAHDLLPREARPGQARAQRRLYEAVDAIVVHSEYGRRQLEALGVDPAHVHVIHHGAFDHLAAPPAPAAADNSRLPPELARVSAPVVLFFGLLRPYKGIEVLLRAWRGVDDAELWIVGRPRMPIAPLKALAGPGVRFVSRFVSDAELRSFFARADLVVLPYARTERFDQSGVLATALAFAKPIVLSDIGSFGEVADLGAARLVAPDDPAALRDAITGLLSEPGERERLGLAARAAAAGPYSWAQAASKTLALYRRLTQ
ncbi:MAG: glycosyltransferase [Solirubrobacteraceae bacterium]|jgi:glycosyltransferase involved in cell wall biosynthesis